jgi:hypothetical protein
MPSTWTQNKPIIYYIFSVLLAGEQFSLALSEITQIDIAGKRSAQENNWI